MSRPDTNPAFGTYPAREIIPNLDELLADPATVLGRLPIYIGKLKVPMVMYVMTVVVLGLLGFTVWKRADLSDFSEPRMWFIVVVVVSIPVVFVYMSWPGHRGILLGKDGIEIQERDT